MYAPIIALHLIAATIWTGGHLVLFFAVLLPALKARDHQRITAFEQHFEKVGIPALAVLIGTGIYMAFYHVPHFSDWFTLSTAASRTITLKLSFLLFTIVLAAHARLKIIPTLSEKTLNKLAIHISLVTVTAVLFALTGVLHRFGGIW
ncbi:MAG: CopD family protein [Leptospiraceae bacterium]|nr:CopD family protein [Leptospiraceae bacterium]